MAVSTRQALLQALSAAGGSYVSGQQLAETLGVSRAAVRAAAALCTAARLTPRVRAGSCAPPGLPAGRRRPVLHRSHRGLPCTHLFI